MGNVAGKLSNKTSPPLSSTIASSSSGLTAQPRTNGFRQKTPSPPSMPIFSANKGSLLHPNGTPASSGRSSDSSQDWNGSSKSKETSQAAAPVAVSKSSHKHRANHSSSKNHLSDESSSDSDANSDDESESSSQSSDSSSEDEEMRPVSMTELSTSKQVVNGVTTNALSMPSFLSSIAMNSNSLALPSGLDSMSPNLHSSSSNHAKSPTESSKKVPQTVSSASALSLSLSEDSDDSSDDEINVTPSRQLNGSDTQQKKDLPKSGSPPESSGSKSSPFDSMPKFLNNGSAPSASSIIPKVTYSQLSMYSNHIFSMNTF